MNPNIAHIVYASDDKFAEILGVSLVSLYENSMDMSDIIIYILDSDISDKNHCKIDMISQKYNRSSPIWIPAQNINNVLSMNVSVDRGSLSQYARLFISSNLPDDLERVIYLDCDIIVKKSIKSIWNMNLQGKTIGALMDAFSKHYRANIDLKPNDIMFNSGVMLIDLVLWKKMQIENRLLEFIRDHHGMIQQGDQGVLNAVLSHDTYCFHPRFNSVTIFYDFNYSEMLIYRKPPVGFYSREEVEDAVNDPTIIHYTTSFLSERPWINGCKHKYVDEWLKYKALSPWKDAPLWKSTSGFAKRKLMMIVQKMPRRIMIRLTGFAQAYLRPWKNKLKFAI